VEASLGSHRDAPGAGEGPGDDPDVLALYTQVIKRGASLPQSGAVGLRHTGGGDGTPMRHPSRLGHVDASTTGRVTHRPGSLAPTSPTPAITTPATTTTTTTTTPRSVTDAQGLRRHDTVQLRPPVGNKSPSSRLQEHRPLAAEPAVGGEDANQAPLAPSTQLVKAPKEPRINGTQRQPALVLGYGSALGLSEPGLGGEAFMDQQPTSRDAAYPTLSHTGTLRRGQSLASSDVVDNGDWLSQAAARPKVSIQCGCCSLDCC